MATPGSRSVQRQLAAFATRSSIDASKIANSRRSFSWSSPAEAQKNRPGSLQNARSTPSSSPSPSVSTFSGFELASGAGVVLQPCSAKP